jgi:serine/threonine protein kinase/Tol biopolymer transport system component
LALAIGTRLGQYEILSLLGAGGMGEVYRARDAKLNRNVAIKVLPEVFALESDRLARFQREAQVLASLNHPHIAQIYGLEDSTGVRALVMELVEGPTLADRIALGPIAVAEALPIAKQIADALDAAHERGIVHRDLKPANVKITPDGTVKILDFGLAKAPVGDEAGRDLTHSPTVTAAGTLEGTLLGTAAYMSPEQARGRVVDKRTDIWAFGCVLFEMLTGRSPFAGDTLTDTLAKIVEREPEWRTLPPLTPPLVRRLLERCLEKDLKRRLRDIGDASTDLLDANAMLSAPSDMPAGNRRVSVAWVVLLALAGAVLIATASWSLARRSTAIGRCMSDPGGPELTQMTADEGLTLDPALSPDGTLLAYASDRKGNLDIWVQQATGGTPIQVTNDTIDEREPTFSPDGAQIVFRSERGGGGLYAVPTFGGGTPRFLAEGGRRPRFSPDGKAIAYWKGSYIGFSSVPGAYRTFVVPAAGGTPREVGGFTSARFPIWAPDGRLLLLGSRAQIPSAETFDWWIVPADGGTPIKTGTYEQLSAGGFTSRDQNVYPEPGAWFNDRVYFSDMRHLWAIPLLSSNARAGLPEPLTFGTDVDVHVSASQTGVVAFSSVTSTQNIWLVPLDANRGVALGAAQRLTTGRGYDSRASASRDGRTIAYRTETPKPTVIIRNLNTGATADVGVSGSSFGSVISPAGTTLAYDAGDGSVRIVPVRGGAPQLVCERCVTGEWTNDGRSMTAVMGIGPGREIDLVEVASGHRRPLIIAREGVLSRPHLSPDNRLLAFRASNPTTGGRDTVYVAQLHADRAVAQDEWVLVTPDELDVRPCGWSPDGGLLYFLSSRDGTRCLYAQRVDKSTCRLIGDAFAVQHFNGVRNYRAGGAGVVSTGPSNAIVDAGFLFDQPVNVSNIWTMRRAR